MAQQADPRISAAIWGIHAGSSGDGDETFMKAKCVALGFENMGDLLALPKDREAFKARLQADHPDNKPGAIPVKAGQLFRFVYEMAIGDLVVYPSKHDRRVHIGRVEGPYVWEGKAKSYRHRRAVTWLQDLPRTHFSQGALYEIGSAMSLFAIKNYADEYRAALDPKSKPAFVADNAEAAAVAAGIEETTNDFILKKLARDLKGHAFADFVAHLLNAMGYRTKVSPEGPDGGVDILAHKDELGFEPPIIKVQVKSSEGNLGDPVVSALYGKLSHGEYALIVTLGAFTNQAKTFARSKSNLRLIDGQDLVGLILEHYEQFDSRYKGLIPLKRVFVPMPLEEEE